MNGNWKMIHALFSAAQKLDVISYGRSSIILIAVTILIYIALGR